MKIIIIFFGLFFPILLLSGCHSSGNKNSSGQVGITDMYGRQVVIPEEVDKIAGVGPGALRLLVYMGLANRISGIEDVELRPGRPYAFAWPELLKKPIIGPYMGGDAELITVNAHDVIFMAFSSASDADQLQKNTGIPVVALNSGNLRNARNLFFESLRLIGRITGNEERADSLKHFVMSQIQLLDSLTSFKADKTKLTAYVGGVSFRGARGIASTEAHYTPFVFTNVRNVAGDLNVKESVNPTGTYVDIEQIILWNPDFMFIDGAGLDLVQRDITSGSPLAETLRAFEKGNVYTLMPHNWYSTNFENVLINSWFVGKTIYPGTFSGFCFEQKAREIYRFMLGRDVFDKMKSTYNGWEKL